MGAAMNIVGFLAIKGVTNEYLNVVEKFRYCVRTNPHSFYLSQHANGITTNE
jgi:hypothetical protein